MPRTVDPPTPRPEDDVPAEGTPRPDEAAFDAAAEPGTAVDDAPTRVRMTGADRRTQLLAVAQGLFSSEGYHHVSMDDIADGAAVSKPVLYRHFPSKLDLYLAVVDEGGRWLVDAITRALEPLAGGLPVTPPEARAVVRDVVRAYFEYVAGAGSASSLLFESDVTRDAEVRARVDRAAAQAADGIETVLAAVVDVPREQVHLLASGLVAMAQTAATAFQRDPDRADLDETVALVARLAWRGVAGLVREDLA